MKNINVRKRTAVIAAAVMAMMLLMPVAAFAEPASDGARSEYIFDASGSLTAEQQTILDTRCSWLKDDGMNVIMDIESSSSSAPADQSQIADSRAAGLGGGNGVVFVIDTVTHESTLRAYGTASALFTPNNRAAQISGIAAAELADNDLYRACRSVIYNIDGLVNGGYEPEQVDYFRPSVVDNAGYLNDEAVQSLTARLDELRDRYNVDVAVVIDDQMWGDSAEEAADNTYDYCFYGAGVDDDGVLLYISKEPRMYQITTFGSGITAFTDYGIEYMQSLIVPKLQNDDYYSACMAYSNGADELLRQAADGTPYDVGSDDVELTAGERTGASLGFGIILALIIALIAYAISTRIKVNQMNTAREQADAHGYMKPGSFNLQTRQDVFLYSHLDRREKPKEPPAGSGGSTVHVSSSGRSHGGGGGSY